MTTRKYDLGALASEMREVARGFSFNRIEEEIFEAKERNDKVAENYWRDILQIKWRRTV